MANAQIGRFVRHMLDLSAAAHADLSDGQLLDRFIANRDEGAFTTLVQRHGPLVLGVCRRMLRDEHAAEDACQAVFLVLARKTNSIRKRSSVASWLYGVAYRVASRARLVARRAGGVNRRRDVILEETMTHSDPGTHLVWKEIQAILDEELHSLPEKYRAPLLLCVLEGKTHEAGARELRIPVGTMSWRLAKGRELLHKRLAHRGITLSVGVVFTAIAENAVQATMPLAVLETTVKAAMGYAAGAAITGVVSATAVLLAEGVMKTMIMTKLKLTAAGLLAAGVLLTGAGVATYRGLATEEAQTNQPEKPKPVARQEPKPKKPGEPRTDLYGDPLPEGAIARLGTVRFRTGDTVGRLFFSPDGKTLISRAWNGTASFWDASTAEELRHVAMPFEILGLFPDGKPLAVLKEEGDEGAYIHLWDFASDKKPLAAKIPPPPPIGTVILGQAKEWLSGFAVSPDAKVLAGIRGKGETGKADSDLIIILWELPGEPGCRQLRELKETRRLFEFQGQYQWGGFAPKEKILVAAFRKESEKKETVIVWNVTSNKELRRFPVPSNSKQGKNCAFAISGDGKLLALGLPDKTIRLYDLAAGREIQQLTGHAGEVGAVAFSADAKLLASGGRDSAVRVWDIAGGKEIAVLKGHLSWVEAVAFSADGKTVASGGQDYMIRLWNTTTKRELLPTGGHQKWIMALALSPDGKTVATTGWDKTIRLWDTATGKEVGTMALPNLYLNCLAFSPDGKFLVGGRSSGKQAIRLWDMSTKEEIPRFQFDGSIGFNAIAFSPDGKWLATGSGDEAIRLWDATSGKEVSQFKGSGKKIGCLAFSPDGKTLAAGFHALHEDDPGNVRIWEIAGGDEFYELKGLRRGGINSIAFSPDGKMLAAGCDARVHFAGTNPDTSDSIHLWDLPSRKDIRQFRLETIPSRTHRAVNSITFSTDGRTLLSAEEDGTIMVYEVSTAKPRRVLAGHRASVRGIACAPDGRTLISASVDHTGLSWDLLKPVSDGRNPNDLWKDLSKTNSRTAYNAICSLVANPKQAAAVIRDYLRPVTSEAVRRIPEWVKDLDAADFPTREKATAELEKVLDDAGPALRAALRGQPSAELRRRAESLLERLERAIPTAEQLRASRALEVLEHIATPEARQLLEKLAGGAAEARVTQEAKASLARLAKR